MVKLALHCPILLCSRTQERLSMLVLIQESIQIPDFLVGKTNSLLRPAVLSLLFDLCLSLSLNQAPFTSPCCVL